MYVLGGEAAVNVLEVLGELLGGKADVPCDLRDGGLAVLQHYTAFFQALVAHVLER